MFVNVGPPLGTDPRLPQPPPTEWTVMFDKLWELCGEFGLVGPQASLCSHLQSFLSLSLFPPLGFLYLSYPQRLMAWKFRYESHVNNVAAKKKKKKKQKRKKSLWRRGEREWSLSGGRERANGPHWHTTIRPSDRKWSAHASCLRFLSLLPTFDPHWYRQPPDTTGE